MDNYEHSDVLYHYGRKGMKWYQNIFGKKNKGKASEPEKEMTIEERKTAVLRSRSASELYKNADLFSDRELNVAYQRLCLEKNIANLEPKQASRGERFVDGTNKWGQKIHNLYTNGSNLYNDVAKLYNTFLKGGKSPLPIIRDNDKKVANKVAETIEKEADKVQDSINKASDD